MNSTATTTNLCTATTKAGRPCQNPALPGSAYCWWHDPSRAGERAEARSKGGRARHGRTLGDVANNGELVTIESLGDVTRVLVRELNEVLRLERSISRGRAVGYLCQIAAGIYQASELEQRLAALEQRIGNG